MFVLTGMWFFSRTLHLRIRGDKDIKSLVLRYRNKLSDDACEYEFDIKGNGYGKWHAKLNLAAIDLKVIYHDVYVITEKGEEPVAVGKLRNMIRFPLYDGKYRDRSSGMFMHPYITPDLDLAIQYREYTENDTLLFRIGEAFVLLLYFFMKKSLSKKNIVLVYEKFCKMAEDNGYYFFKYCMDNKLDESMGVNMYYIIDSHSKDMVNILPYRDNTIGFMSIKHKLYMLAAKWFVSTDTRKHIYAWRSRMSMLEHMIRSKPLMFLQHGVTALKRVDYIYGKGNYGACNLFVTTSDYEKNIVKKYFGYNDNEIVVTGFARWDVLSDKSRLIIPGGVDYNMVLIMPTWRNWLEEVDGETFVQSEYYNRYRELLSSPELLELLERRNLQLCFYIHPKFREYINEFDSMGRRVRIIQFGDEPLNQLIMRCKMLVTDYSSVSWDVYYQHKPVVFYQFDLDKYLEAQGSYLDMERELFGDRVEDMNSLIDTIDWYAADGFRNKQIYEDMYGKFFKYTDSDNSRRIAEYLQKNL